MKNHLSRVYTDGNSPQKKIRNILIKEMQIEVTVRSHYTPIKMTKTKK